MTCQCKVDDAKLLLSPPMTLTIFWVVIDEGYKFNIAAIPKADQFVLSLAISVNSTWSNWKSQKGQRQATLIRIDLRSIFQDLRGSSLTSEVFAYPFGKAEKRGIREKNDNVVEM